MFYTKQCADVIPWLEKTRHQSVYLAVMTLFIFSVTVLLCASGHGKPNPILGLFMKKKMIKIEIFPHFVLAGYLHTVNCKLNANAAKASNWYKCNLLKGNLKKYQTITICNFQGNSSVCVNILLGSDIKSSDSLKLLGAMIYSKMNFNCVGQSESWSHYETQKFNPQCSQATTIQSCHSPPSYILSPHLAFLQS